MKNKVTVIGAGNVGASLAQLVLMSGLADVVLFDIVEGMPQGKALDMSQAAPLWGSAARATGTNSYADIQGSDVVVITAGLPRKPGMSRDDLLSANARIVGKAASEVKSYCPGAIVIVVTNPVDTMAFLAQKTTGFESKRVMGMGGVLDTARLRTFISMQAEVAPPDVEALVLGGHGDQMVPLRKYININGIPAEQLMDSDTLSSIIERTKNGGAEIVSLLKAGSAYYAPAASAFEMVKAVLLDEKRLLPCSALLDGQYGARGIYMGVPALLGKDGVERIVELPLEAKEQAAFDASVAAVRELTAALDA